MNGVASLYYQRDAATGLYIDPATNQPSYRITSEVQRGINDASAVANAPKMQYSSKHELRAWDGKKTPLPPTSAEMLMQQGSEPWDRQVARSTSQAMILGASLYSLPIRSAGAAVMYSSGAGVIAGGTKATFNYMENGSLSMRDVPDIANATITGAAGAYLVTKTGGLPLYAGERMAVELVGLTAINTTGAVVTTYVKNEVNGTSASPLMEGGIAAISTIGGYGMTYVGTKGNMDPFPVRVNFLSSIGQESISAGIQKTIQKKENNP